MIVGVGQGQDVLGLLRLDGEVTGERSQVGLAAQDLLVDVADDVEHTANGGQTLRNVVDACNATGVNGTHRKLRAGLADGLSGDDADGGADGDGTTGREVPAIALLAYAVLGTAGQQRAQGYLLEAGVNQLLDVGNAFDVLVALEQDGAVSSGILGEAAANQVGVERVGAGDDEVVGAALLRTAVLLADDDVWATRRPDGG